MVRRRYAALLRDLLRRWPAVVVLGPRQCGKTTLVRQALPDWTYLDLERPADATPVAADIEGRLGQLGDRVVFDEAQQVPALFAVLRGVIDAARRRHGRFVLLGSASPSLVRGIAESLAGRVAFLDLPPFRWDEVGRATHADLANLWFRGGFPKAYLARTDAIRQEWLEAYTRAVVERDLPLLGLDVSGPQMRRLWQMLAHANGGLWNASQLGQSLGVSYHTANRYMEILEQTFHVRRLAPFSANLRKRLVKSPKIYLRDSGVLHFLLGLESRKALDTHPARGASWEGFVIDQMISALERVRPASRCWFWRTATGQEVDLLIDHGQRQVPIEIKLQTTPASDDAKTVRMCMSDLGLARGYVVHAGRERYSLGQGVTAVPAMDLLARPASTADL